jgi:hypothetical protein
MSEVSLIRLIKSSDFDGTTPITLTRDNFAVSGQRNYVATLVGPAGTIGADFFGIFSPESAKVVGVAFTTSNPRSVVRVIDSSNRPRDQISLTPFFQYLLVNPGDRLAVFSSEAVVTGPVPVELTLAVNELTEAQHVDWAIAHPPAIHQHTRFRIVRRGDFTPAMAAAPWTPNFFWNPTQSYFEARDDLNQGPIAISTLSPFMRMYGTLYSVRYSNSNNDGKLVVVENQTRAFHEAQVNIQNVRWSRVTYLSHDDLIILSATAAPAGGDMVVDIETVSVEPGDRLRGRYLAAEAVGGNNL